MEQIITFILENWILLLVVITVFVNRKKLIWEPLSGGNGHVAMDELAKGIILAAFVFAVYKEANRTDLANRIFDDTFFLILVSAIFAIANIHIDFKSFIGDNKRSEYTKETETFHSSSEPETKVTQ